MPPSSAYRIVRDEVMLDGNPQQNLATFITTAMEPEAESLMTECLNRTTVDGLQPLQIAELERRCVSSLANLWHAPDPDAVVGTSTGGSSEACMLAALALKIVKLHRTPVAKMVRGDVMKVRP
ncbi:MAG TPA: pyridoxal-dependent decarboxylase [Acidimicrobiales bacterium]|nr:pyridoxal-dependent decarboxylase [Acidimicrobiales bacterium]